MNRKVAFVTGSGNGIGKAIALKFAKEGYDVITNDLRVNLAEQVSEEIKKLGVDSIALGGDVSDEETMKKNFEEIKNHFGRLDVLVQNAGICPIRKMDHVEAKQLDRSFKINVISMFIGGKYAAEIMKDQPEGGVILNACSQSGFRETPVTFEYTTTKWGIRGYTKALAQALEPYHIRVNSYCPGTVITEMQDQIAKKTAKEMHVPSWVVRTYQKKSQPLGRFQTVEDIANLAYFLASDKAKAINGQNILCNGGQVMN